MYNFERTAYQLEVLTQSYWFLSRILAGRNKERLTVEKAIKSVNIIEVNLGPTRPLLRRVRALGDVIVQGRFKSKTKSKIPATISILARAPPKVKKVVATTEVVMVATGGE